jgi:hypothetical protein
MLGPWDVVVIVAAAATGALAAVAWVAAVVCWVAMVRHRSPHRSLAWQLFHGMAAFDPENFNERGRQWQRWFVRCFVGFFVAMLATVVVVALGTRR